MRKRALFGAAAAFAASAFSLAAPSVANAEVPPGFGCTTDVFVGRTGGDVTCASGPGRSYALRIHCTGGYYVQGPLQHYTVTLPPGSLNNSPANCYKSGTIDAWTIIWCCPSVAAPAEEASEPKLSVVAGN